MQNHRSHKMFQDCRCVRQPHGRCGDEQNDSRKGGLCHQRREKSLHSVHCPHHRMTSTYHADTLDETCEIRTQEEGAMKLAYGFVQRSLQGRNSYVIIILQQQKAHNSPRGFFFRVKKQALLRLRGARPCFDLCHQRSGECDPALMASSSKRGHTAASA